VGLAGLKESHEQSASVINTRPDGRRTGDGGNLRQYFAALHMRKPLTRPIHGMLVSIMRGDDEKGALQAATFAVCRTGSG
jgi:hypothetical protein